MAASSSWRALGAFGAALLTLVVAVAGCARTPAGAAANGEDQLWLRLTACIRAHGMPDWPDPTPGPDGRLGFPGDAPRTTQQVQDACRSLFAQVPANEQTGTPMPADVPGALRFAACLRTHGFPGWPDPDSSGRFPLDRLGPSSAVKRALTSPPAACRSLVPQGGVRVSS
jgi:hypothetical protein